MEEKEAKINELKIRAFDLSMERDRAAMELQKVMEELAKLSM